MTAAPADTAAREAFLADAREAFWALAPYATLEDSHADYLASFEAGLCAAHDALRCSRCGVTM